MYLIFQLLSTTTALKLGQEQTRPHRPKLGGLGVGDEEKRLEGDLARGDAVGLGHGAVLVLGDGFVELVILILLNVIRLPGPDGLGRVAQLAPNPRLSSQPSLSWVSSLPHYPPQQFLPHHLIRRLRDPPGHQPQPGGSRSCQ